MALLDTTVFVDLGGRSGKKRAAAAEEVLRRILGSGETLMTSRINLAELYVGAELSDDRPGEQSKISSYLSWVAVLELDEGSSMEYGRLRAHLKRHGKPAGDLDTLIGAIALANGHSIVTRNPGHFANMQGLTIIEYGT